MKPSNNAKPSKNTYYDKNKSNIFKPPSPIKAHQRTISAPKINEANFNKISSLKDDIKHIDIKQKHDIYDGHVVNMNHHKEYLSFFKEGQERHFLVDNTKNSRYVKQEALRSNILNDPNAQSNIVLVHNPKPLQETLEINSKQKSFFRKFQENKEINPPLNEFRKKKTDLILETDWTHHQEKHTSGQNELQAAGLSSKRKMHKNLSSIIFGDERLIKTQNDFFHDESSKIGSGKHSTKLSNKYKSEGHTQELTSLLTESCLPDKTNNRSPNKEKQFFKYKVKTEVFNTELDRYEIPNNENSNFKIDDLKRNFFKNGIHIYDLKTIAKNSTIFRIRKLNDNVLIKEKFNKLSEEMGEKGIKIQRYQPVYSKKCQVSEMPKYENRKRNLEIQEKEANNKRINVDKSQKLSNNIVDTKYKRGSDKLIVKKR